LSSRLPLAACRVPGIYVVVHGDIKLVSTTGAWESADRHARARAELRRTGHVPRAASPGRCPGGNDALVLLVPKASVLAELDRNPKIRPALVGDA
jgi:hypothetical protein